MKLSFLTSCMNRLDHLKQTYLQNINNNRSISGCKVEFVLLNYNSSDNLDEWVNENLLNLDVEFSYIKTDQPTHFHMSKSKNMLGNHATGNILCWLDADNFTNSGFVDYIKQTYHNDTNKVLKVDWSPKTAGSCGRIVCSRSNFIQLGGYDEKMIGWGYEEIDFWKRQQKNGAKIENIPNRFLGKLKHTNSQRFENYKKQDIVSLDKDHPFKQMQVSSNYLNYLKSEFNLQNNNLVANK